MSANGVSFRHEEKTGPAGGDAYSAANGGSVTTRVINVVPATTEPNARNGSALYPSSRLTEYPRREFLPKTSLCKSPADFFGLSDIVLSHSPFMIIFKSAVGAALCLVSDKFITSNPDSVTSSFTVLLLIAPAALIGIEMSWTLLQGVIVGSLWGSVFNLIFMMQPLYATDHGPPAPVDPLYILLTIPLAIALTIYCMYLLRLHASGLAVSAAYFSSLFVQLVRWSSYSSLPINHIWLSTLVVRVVATLTAVVSAAIVNFSVAGAFYHHILSNRMTFVERAARNWLGDIATAPDGDTSQTLFSLMIESQKMIAAVHRERALYRRVRHGIWSCITCRCHRCCEEDAAPTHPTAALVPHSHPPHPSIPASITGSNGVAVVVPSSASAFSSNGVGSRNGMRTRPPSPHQYAEQELLDDVKATDPRMAEMLQRLDVLLTIMSAHSFIGFVRRRRSSEALWGQPLSAELQDGLDRLARWYDEHKYEPNIAAGLDPASFPPQLQICAATLAINLAKL